MVSLCQAHFLGPALHYSQQCKDHRVTSSQCCWELGWTPGPQFLYLKWAKPPALAGSGEQPFREAVSEYTSDSCREPRLWRWSLSFPALETMPLSYLLLQFVCGGLNVRCLHYWYRGVSCYKLPYAHRRVSVHVWSFVGVRVGDGEGQS